MKILALFDCLYWEVYLVRQNIHDESPIVESHSNPAHDSLKAIWDLHEMLSDQKLLNCLKVYEESEGIDGISVFHIWYIYSRIYP